MLTGVLWLQKDSLLGTVGMQCKVGTCLYAPPPPAPPAPPPAPPPALPHVSHPEMAAIFGTAAVLVLLFAGTVLLIQKDRAAMKPARASGVVLADSMRGFSEELATMEECAASRLPARAQRRDLISDWHSTVAFSRRLCSACLRHADVLWRRLDNLTLVSAVASGHLTAAAWG